MDEKKIEEVMALVFKLVHAERDGYPDSAKDMHEENIRTKLRQLGASND